MSGQTGSDYVYGALDAEGVDVLFGLIGEGNAHLLDRVNDHPVAFRYARHEQAAVTMADAYARVTGEVGVCTLTHGPGVTNGATGLAAADRDGIPLVVLVGDTAQAGRETSLQYLDHERFAAPISGYQTRAESPGTLPETLARAFDAARTERTPAVVELPAEIQEGEAPAEPYAPRPRHPQRPRPDPERLDEATALLEAADRPAILAGGGAAASGAGEAAIELAERLGAPLATTFFAKGLVPDSHPIHTGIVGTFMTPASEALFTDVDALLAVGARLSGKTTRYGALWGEADVIQVDVDRGAIGTHREPAVGLVGDARATCRALAGRVDPHPDRAEAVRDRIAAAGTPADVERAEREGLIDPRDLVEAIGERVDGGIVTVGSGNNTGFPPVFHRMEAGRMLVNGNFGTMGYSLPAALGAAVAAPDEPVVCYTGDGAFLQVLQEVETAVRLGLGILIVVLNDARYGIIGLRQELEYGRETAAGYDSPDFAAVARGLGARAATVRSREDLSVVDEFLAAEPDVPLVLDARTIPEVSRPGFPPY
ncbi:MAG: thiamine pyrophosphate-binding protein [Haloarculaceae archaeon]